VGEVGLVLKEATSAVATATLRVAVFEPVPFVTVKATVFDPAVV
jgi:hypothetical protein